MTRFDLLLSDWSTWELLTYLSVLCVPIVLLIRIRFWWFIGIRILLCRWAIDPLDNPLFSVADPDPAWCAIGIRILLCRWALDPLKNSLFSVADQDPAWCSGSFIWAIDILESKFIGVADPDPAWCFIGIRENKLICFWVPIVLLIRFRPGVLLGSGSYYVAEQLIHL